MLQNQVFYHQITRRLVIAFGNLFKSIYIRKFSSDGQEVSRRVVPIRYAPKDWFLETQRLRNLENREVVETNLPILTFEITSMSPDSSRKLNTMNRIVKTSSNTVSQFTFSHVPMNVGFQLSAYFRLQEEGLQIFEQIIPYFNPYFNITINEPLGIVRDIPIELGSSSPQEEYERGEGADGNRKTIWTWDFTMKANYYGFIRESKIIRKVNTQIYDSLYASPQSPDVSPLTTASERLTITPDPGDAEPTSDFGYTEVLQQLERGE